MAEDAADISHGWTASFGTSELSVPITNLKPPGYLREFVDTSHQGTTVAKTKIPVDLFEVTPFEFDAHYKPGTNPPIDGAMETVTLTSPANTTLIFSAGMGVYEPDAPHLGLMTVHIVCEISGTVTVDPEGAATGDASFDV